MQTRNSSTHSSVREVNLSLVLRTIHNEAPISRAQLAVQSGLNKSTISSLVDELLGYQLIYETGMISLHTGRPATQLEINPQAGCILGVEFGVDFVAVVRTNILGNINWRQVANADPTDDQETTLSLALSLVDQAIADCQRNDSRLLGLGVATPGTVDLEEGILVFAPNLHWRDVPLKRIFAEHAKLKVGVENDANAAAIAEHLFGAARKSQNFIFIFAGVGIGGGLFLNGELYRGNNGYAGEIGHSPIMAEPFQMPCHCGNRGCWETYANQYSIIQRMQSRLEVKRKSIVPKLMAEQNAPLSVSIIKQAADQDDTEAQSVFAEAGTAMGQGIASLINIFNPEKVVLGGPLSIAGKYLLPSIKETVTRQTLPEIDQQTEVVLSSFGPDASQIGAVAVVVNEILSNPTEIERR